MQETNTNWPYDQSVDINAYYGFVYLITHRASGRMYVGRKYLTLKRGKKRLPSKWQAYWGSCKELTALIEAEGEEAIERRILTWCRTRQDINYEEMAEQVRREVLTALLPDGSRAYFNGNILNRFYAKRSVA